MTISTSLSKRLGIEHPVMLAPMGFVSGGALAAAVSAGGGFGIIGGGYADPDWLEREFALAGQLPCRLWLYNLGPGEAASHAGSGSKPSPAGDHAVVWRCNAVPT